MRWAVTLHANVFDPAEAAATPHRHSPCWLMPCATGLNAAGSVSGEIFNEEFLKPLGLTANALALCRNDRSTARRLGWQCGLRLVPVNRVNATALSLLVRPSAGLGG
jgi:hypothetical protein